MKRDYELAVVFRMDPNQAVIDEAIQQVQDWVSAEDHGEILTVNRWGQRRLAYEIDKQRDGYYVFFDALIDPKGLPELEENLKLATSVLRYLLVRKES